MIWYRMKKKSLIVFLFFLMGCTNTTRIHQNLSISDIENTCGMDFKVEDEVFISLKNSDIVLYPNYSFNFQVVFYIISDTDLSNQELSVSFDYPIEARLELYNNEAQLIDDKDYHIANGIDYKTIAEQVQSGDSNLRRQAADRIISSNEGFDKCLENIEEINKPILYSYTALLSFDNPVIGVTLSEMIIGIGRKQYTFNIGSITFNAVDHYTNQLIIGATRGNVGYSSDVSSKKRYIDVDGNLMYEFIALSNLTIDRVIPTNEKLKIVDLKLRVNNNGREFVKQVADPSNMDIELKKDDQFSFIVTYELNEESEHLTYYQSYNSLIVFSSNNITETFILESGTIRTVPTLYQMISDNQQQYKHYYFDYLERIDDENWILNP